RSIDLNAFQFSTFLSRQYQPSWFGTGARSPKRLTAQQCHEDFIEPAAHCAGDCTEAAAHGARPMLRAVWCARADREFEDLYDVSVIAVTQDRSREALISRLSMQGVTYGNAIALAKRFLGAVSWAQCARSRYFRGIVMSSRGIAATPRRPPSGAPTTTMSSSTIRQSPRTICASFATRAERRSPRTWAAPTACSRATATSGRRAV